MAKPRPLPPVDYLYSRFIPDFDKGTLTWRSTDARQKKRVGKIAGCKNSFGYHKVTLDKKPVSVHRVLWKMFYKQEPPDIIDHIDRNKDNNSISNLREATTSLNVANTGLYKHNSSGIKGVSFHKTTRKFVVTRMHEGKDYYLGTVHNLKEAERLVKAWCEDRNIKYAVSPTGEVPDAWLG